MTLDLQIGLCEQCHKISYTLVFTLIAIKLKYLLYITNALFMKMKSSGYMAPEYVMHGQFSIKSDVFSFGVLLLEIVSGQKNAYYSDRGGDILSYVSMNS